MFPAPHTVPAKGRTKCGSKNYFSAGALYRKLPIVCVAFLFELVTSCSSSKCSYYQVSVNTFSKVIVWCFQIACCKTVGRLSKCANSIIIQVYLCLGPLRCTLKSVLACRIYDIVSSSSFIWFYRLVQVLTARTMLASIWGASTVTFFKGWHCQPHAKTPSWRATESSFRLPYLSRECPVLRRQVFSLTQPMTGRIWWLQRQV